jgi:hypothetical protein
MPMTIGTIGYPAAVWQRTAAALIERRAARLVKVP